MSFWSSLLPWGSGLKDKHSIVVTLRSDAVELSAVDLYKKEKPQVVASIREDLAIDKSFSEPRHRARTLAILTKLLRVFSRNENVKSPDGIHVILSAPWTRSSVRIINYAKEGGFKFTHELYKEVVKTDLATLGSELNFSGATAAVELEPMQFRLNGYRVEKPFGKTTDTASFDIYASLGSVDLTNKIKDSVSEIYPSANVDFHTFPFVSLFVTKSIIDNLHDNFVLVDINGEATEITAVKEGSVIALSSLPIGVHTIIRNIATEFTTDISEAKSIYHAYLGKALSSKVNSRVKKVAANVAKEWKITFHDTLTKMARTFLIPEKLVALGKEGVVPIFCESVKECDMTSITTKSKPFSVNLFNKKQLSRFCDSSQVNGVSLFGVVGTAFIDQYRHLD